MKIDTQLVRGFLKDMLLQDGYDQKLIENYLETPDIIEYINLLCKRIENGDTSFTMKQFGEGLKKFVNARY